MNSQDLQVGTIIKLSITAFEAQGAPLQYEVVAKYSKLRHCHQQLKRTSTGPSGVCFAENAKTELDPM
jgi:hypothetical protein